MPTFSAPGARLLPRGRATVSGTRSRSARCRNREQVGGPRRWWVFEVDGIASRPSAFPMASRSASFRCSTCFCNHA